MANYAVEFRYCNGLHNVSIGTNWDLVNDGVIKNFLLSVSLSDRVDMQRLPLLMAAWLKGHEGDDNTCISGEEIAPRFTTFEIQPVKDGKVVIREWETHGCYRASNEWKLISEERV